MTGSPKQDWAQLFRVACDLIQQVNSEQEIIDYWTFGGGTAMMLQIDPRESRDVDFFLRDPQLLPFLVPQKRDFQFTVRPFDYFGDGVEFLKIVFEAGEIDFIVDSPKTADPVTVREIEGWSTRLETIQEIIAKKIIHRGSSMPPRDIFDIAAAAERHSNEIILALRQYPGVIARTIDALDRLNPEFVKRAIAELAVRDRFQTIAATVLDRAKRLLRAV